MGNLLPRATWSLTARGELSPRNEQVIVRLDGREVARVNEAICSPPLTVVSSAGIVVRPVSGVLVQRVQVPTPLECLRFW